MFLLGKSPAVAVFVQSFRRLAEHRTERVSRSNQIADVIGQQPGIIGYCASKRQKFASRIPGGGETLPRDLEDPVHFVAGAMVDVEENVVGIGSRD